MNRKQAIVLGIGIILAIALVATPPIHTPLRTSSTQTLSDGTIVTVKKSHLAPWQPVGLVLVVLVTGFTLYRFQQMKQP